MLHRTLSILLVGISLAWTAPALAGDGGEAAAPDGGEADSASGGATEDSGATNAGDAADASTSSQLPLACDGALCDTSNDSTCDVAGGAVGGPSGSLAWLVLAAPGAFLLACRSRQRGAKRPAQGDVTC